MASVPEARVEVDTRDYGITPMRIRVEKGKRLLVLTATVDGQPVVGRFEIVVPANGLVTKRFETAAGKLWEAEDLASRKARREWPFEGDGPAP